MKHGLIKVAAATPRIRVADTASNARAMIALAQQAAEKGARILVFPELTITGCTCADLFFNETLVAGAKKALQRYLNATAQTDLLSVVGVPLEAGGLLYNCAAICQSGKVLGVVPKQTLSFGANAGESRYFSAPAADLDTEIALFGSTCPFSTRLIFACESMPTLKLAIEIGSDLGAAIPPSSHAAMSGATLICNGAALPETVGAAERAKALALSQSARAHVAYLSANAGEGESTTDLVFAGGQLIAEDGDLLAYTPPFAQNELTYSEIDLSRIAAERRRLGFGNSGTEYKTVGFELTLCDTVLTRKISPTPFIPADPAERAARCEQILKIQTAGLRARAERAYAKKLVLGISGGLDSTLALLVMVRAIDAMGRDRRDVLAVTMPCFGTTSRTKNNATLLCEELGVDFRCVDIFNAVNSHFADIGHDPEKHDVTYENSQARERTQILMDIANECGGMVVGTGDLSELALGWATYNGDQMSMYGVNADLPKTLIRHVVAHCADTYEAQGKDKIATALRDILSTPVSPELLPANENGEIAQKTEDLVGPYEIHDFYLYYLLRYGFSPEKLFRLACHALGDTYDRETLKKWLITLLRRFFAQQFKRSCMPDGPKVGSVALSPRGAWLMPSDASSAIWLSEAERI